MRKYASKCCGGEVDDVIIDTEYDHNDMPIYDTQAFCSICRQPCKEVERDTNKGGIRVAKSILESKALKELIKGFPQYEEIFQRGYKEGWNDAVKECIRKLEKGERK